MFVLLDNVQATNISAPSTPPIDTTGASLLLMNLSYATPPANAPTDSYGNTWTPLTPQDGAYGGGMQAFYAANPVVGPGHTFTATGAVACAMEVSVWAGAALVGVFDQAIGNASLLSPAQTGSLTPSVPNALIWSAIGGADDVSHSINSGFTLLDQDPVVGGVNYGAATAYLIQGGAAPVNPQWTVLDQFGGNTFFGSTLAVFKPAVATATWPGYQAPFGWK